MKRRNRLLLPYLLILLFFCFQPGGQAKFDFQIDKLAHFILFLGLGGMLCYQFQSRVGIWLLWAVVLGFATEIIQQWIPGRSLDFYDALADTGGILAAYYLYPAIQKWLDPVLVKLGA